MKTMPKHFGQVVHTTLADVLNPEKRKQWRDLMYTSKLLVLKGLYDLTPLQLWEVHAVFGTPWVREEYRESFEKSVAVEEGSTKVITEYSNSLTKTRIGDKSLPWHHDIPWHRERRYPIRSLYPTNIGNGTVSTKFLDNDVLWKRLPESEWNRLYEADMRIQYWYDASKGVENTPTQVIPLVEKHPHTQRHSILLNSFGPTEKDKFLAEYPHSTKSTGAWAIDCWSRSEHLGLAYLEKLHALCVTPDNVYEHEWELGDLVLFDNYSGIAHGRDKITTEGVERSFWRMNVKHYWQK